MLRVKKQIFIIPLVIFQVLLFLVCQGLSQQGGRTLNYHFQVKLSPATNANSSLTRFFVTIPFTSLVFVNADSGYVAGFDFNLFVKDKEGDVIYEKAWSEDVIAQSYRDTKNDSLYFYLTDERTLQAGTYKIIIEAIDENVGISSFKEKDFIIRDQGDQALILGDILSVYGKINQESDFSQLKIIPRNSIRSDFSLVCEAKEIQDFNWTGEVIWIENNEERYTDELTLLQEENNIRLFTSYTIGDAPHGRYSVFFRLKGNRTVLETEPVVLEVFKMVAFMNEDNLERAIEQIEYIGEGAIYDSLTSASTLDQKQYWFDQFWNVNYPSKDSLHNPIKEEYYRRIRYSNQSFGAGIEGWKTDRGHTYVVYGPPDQIDRRVNNRMWRYEIWDYISLRKQFIFVDEYGTGNYHLIREN